MFSLRKISSNIMRRVGGVRCMSSGGKLVDLAIDDDGIATVTMQRLPVNSLNLELIQSISGALDDVTKNKGRAVILTSSSPTVFSAGLDIMEMYKPDMKRAEEFWSSLQDLWVKLFGSSFITAAAINGHAPAGGCLLAMSCEYRAMVSGKFRTGLNETALGIVAPDWFMFTLCNTIPKREAELALTTGRMFSVDEALKVGLIDATATDKADAIEKCKEFIEKFDNIPPLARSFTKQKFRAAPLQWMKQNKQEDTQIFLTYLKNPKVQQSLEMYIQMLKMKAGK